MKTYQLKDFESFDKLHSAMAEELGGLLASTKVTGKFGEGSIVSIVPSKSNFGNSFCAYIEFPTEVKQLQLSLAMKSGAIHISEDKGIIFHQFMEALDQASAEQIEIDKIKAEELKTLRAQAEEAEKERVKKEKQAAKFEEHKKKILAGLDDLKASKTVIDGTFSAALGWLAKNMTSISARMPDFCEKWFRDQFGNVKATIIDSSKKTTGGYAMQWGLSLTCGIKTSAFDQLPVILKPYLGENSHDIKNTQFIYSLLTDCGFKVGKASDQNIDEIKYLIPADELESFEAAYAA